MEQNQQNQNQQQQPQIQGWQDVQISPELPLSALVQFLNVLNQRLVAVENNTTIKNDEGKYVSLTDLYAQQAQAELEARQAAAKAEPEDDNTELTKAGN